MSRKDFVYLMYKLYNNTNAVCTEMNMIGGLYLVYTLKVRCSELTLSTHHWIVSEALR